MIVVVGSKNPAKAGAVRDAFMKAYPSLMVRVQEYEVVSCVPHNPVGDAQCMEGARNRARAAMGMVSGAEYAVGIESGISHVPVGHVHGKWFERTWVVIVDKDGKEGSGHGTGFPVPEYAAARIRSNQSGLGGITDAHTGFKNTKSGAGYCGLVTRGLLCRREVTRDAIIAALAGFLLPEFFEGSGGGCGF